MIRLGNRRSNPQLIVAMMCLPFGSMLLALVGAKYLRNRRLAGKSR